MSILDTFPASNPSIIPSYKKLAAECAAVLAFLQSSEYADADKDRTDLEGYSDKYGSPKDFFVDVHVKAKDNYVSCLLRQGGMEQVRSMGEGR